MAGAFLITFTMKWALSKLPSLIPQASSSSSSKNSSSSAEQELHNLERTMKRIHATLADAKEREIIDKSVQLRLSELREVAYDVEDLIDDYEYEVLRVKVKARREAMANRTEDNKHDKVFDWNSYCPAVSISDDMMHRMKQIREKFEEITDDWKRINFGENDGTRRNAKIWKPIETTSFFNEDITFGRKDDKNNIIEWLLQGRNETRDVSVLAIIGMGGIGKTTLAQLVYSDPRASRHFELSAWIYVSEDLNVENIIRNIILSFYDTRDNKLSSHEQPEDVKNMSLDLLYKRLKKQLEGKRYFIVLDDVWNQKDLSQLLSSPLVGVGSGKIIVTTRNEKVARTAQITTSIHLEELPFDDCMSLFKRIAFQGVDRTLLHKFSDIGERIVKKCKGVPLAIKVLASVLRFEDTEEKWNEVLKSDFWEDEIENNEVVPILKLSYDHMPVELRPCFMYLSLFRKDSLLEKSTLVQQWMSQGFLHAKGEKTEEDVGNFYINELLQRSILQYSARSEDEFVMHDLIHDLAQFVAKDEYLLLTTDKLDQTAQDIPKTIRHIAIYLKSESEKICLKSLFESKQLRTLMLYNVHGCSNAGSLDNLTCLRTLVLDGDRYLMPEEIMRLPDAFRNLKHLRFLYSGNNCISTLKPISSLYHLQTFHSRSTLELCEGIGDLMSLRHLNGDGLRFMHHEVGWLTNLRTLSNFKLGTESWECKLRDLKDLTNLSGGIHVSGLETVEDSDLPHSEAYLQGKLGTESWECKLRDLKDLTNLSGGIHVSGLETVEDSDLPHSEAYLQGIEKLKLTWSIWGRNERGVDDEKLAAHVLRRFQPRHHNLLTFSVNGYPGTIFPAWLRDASFSKLVELELEWISNCKSLPTLGQLPALKRLTISRMQQVEIVGREFLIRSSNPSAARLNSGCRFPSLEELKFIDMKQWKEWNGVEDSDFPRLRELLICDCPKLTVFPSLHSLTYLEFKEYCDLEALLSNCCLPMLQALCIDNFCNLELAFPDCQSLRSLKELVINGLYLQYIEGLGNLTSLERLEITGCYELDKIAGHRDLDEHLDEWEERNDAEVCIFPNLSELTICSSLMLKTFPSLHSLTRLKFESDCDLKVLSDCNLPKLQTLCLSELSNDELSFPDCQSLRSLKVLIIDGGYDETKLKYIKGLVKLTSLERLEIKLCDAEISADEELPPNLQDVQIHDSPKVERWYKKHVLGGAGPGGSVGTQMDSDTEEEELSEEEDDEQMPSEDRRKRRKI